MYAANAIVHCMEQAVAHTNRQMKNKKGKSKQATENIPGEVHSTVTMLKL